ncbi:MAG: hypothetical protein M1836_004765 [Candelina mexicana]|nr:MAG: hypothetical protein M1836_004765 [Candelina mexicana]
MSPHRRFTFISLPGEIRNQIYNLLLVVVENDQRAGRGNILFRPIQGLRLRPPKVYPAILATNRQIHDEAADFLYGKNTFHCFLTGGMTGAEFPLESLPPFTTGRYFSRIERWAIMLRFRDHSDEESCRQLPRHFATLCNIIAENRLSEVRVECVNCSPRQGLEGRSEQAKHMMGVLDQLRVLRNVTSATVKDITVYHFECYGGAGPLVSSEYLADLKGVMEGPSTSLRSEMAPLTLDPT